MAPPLSPKKADMDLFYNIILKNLRRNSRSFDINFYDIITTYEVIISHRQLANN